MQQLHLVFYTSLLQLDLEDPLPGQHIEPQAPVQVENDETDAIGLEGLHNE